MKLKLSVLVASLVMTNVVSAATAIDLRHSSMSTLQKYLPASKTAFAVSPVQLQDVRVDVDQNQVTHKRVQETYAGIPVWGATAVIHTPTPAVGKTLAATSGNKITMNGVIYAGLEKDLVGTPGFALSDAQKAKAMTQAKMTFEQQSGRKVSNYQREEAKQIIFVDDNQQAHYAFYVSFYVDDHLSGAHRPAMIMDAVSLRVFKTWDRVMTEDLQVAGGIGGNKKTGPLVYDNAAGTPFAMNMLTEVQELVDQYGRPVMAPVCTLRNDDVEVLDVSYGMAPAQAVCNPLTGKHNDMNWISHDASGMRWRFDEVNNGFSPSLDAFYDAVVIKHLYQDWYGVPVLTEQDHKTPMKLRMLVHYGRNFENAFWDGEQMTFGDGGSMFYPLTSLDVGAHEISHGFTEQHSGIGGTDQMGALHEAFSDMAAAAAEYYTTQKNSWMIGITIAKGESPLRYMDHPSRDGMSIDNMKDYHEGIDPHLLAGVFNKAFHLLANTTGWDTRKAFDVMVRANMYYWNASMKTFDEAACGVMSATADAKYSTADVVAAFSKVGIDTGKC